MQGVNLALSSNKSDLAGSLYRSLGDIAVKEDSIDLAKAYFLRAFEYFVDKEDHHNHVSVKTVLGNIEWVSDRLYEVMSYYMEAIDLSEKHNIDNYLPILYLNIGVINTEFDNYANSLDNFSMALEMFKERKDSLNIRMSYSNMGSVYSSMNGW